MISRQQPTTCLPARTPDFQELRGFRGFSLIELLVVIGVIIVLVSLVLAVGSQLTLKSETRETESTLKLLDTAMNEWQIAADRRMTYGIEGEPACTPEDELYDFDRSVYDTEAKLSFDSSNPGLSLLPAVIRRLIRQQQSREILSKIQPRFLQRVEDDTGFEYQYVVDAWDKPLMVIFAGRLSEPCEAEAPDADGTVRLGITTPPLMEEEFTYGIARNRQVLFVSAGPDGQFGDLSADPDTEVYKLAGDNVYSYEPEKP